MCFFWADKLMEIWYLLITDSSHIITESSIILAKYNPFPQSHVAGFQAKSF